MAKTEHRLSVIRRCIGEMIIGRGMNVEKKLGPSVTGDILKTKESKKSVRETDQPKGLNKPEHR